MINNKGNNVTADLSYYKPVNQEQREFHMSKARHKLLIGGYGAGKSYPAIHEMLFHCLENPRHEFLICRNTWDSLEDEIQEDVLRVCGDAGLIKEWVKTKHDLVLPNDCKIMFRPLTLGRAKFKGMHLCGFLIDDPDVNLYQDVISFLWSRLRNPPNTFAVRFQSIITSNWEGRNWLWKTYMRDQEQGGDRPLAYWVCPTTNNPTLHDDYISDMEKIHSKEWMDRYVHCNLNSYIGLIYHEFDVKIHHKSADEVVKIEGLVKILAIDVGMVHPTVILDIVTDRKNIYVVGEWYKKGIKTSHIGDHLQRRMQETRFNKMVIDPSSNKGEQTSGTSTRYILRHDYGIYTEPGINDVDHGIKLTRDLLKPAVGPPKLYIDTARCPNLRREMDTYRFKEPKDMDYDVMDYEEKPVKKNDDAVDAMRYGICYLHKFLKDLGGVNFKRNQRKINWDDRISKLKIYRENPKLRVKKEKQEMYRGLGFSESKIRSLTAAR